MTIATNDQGDTNVFGIILLLDQETTARVERLRSALPPSPIRVDVPHIMLLRGVSSDTHKTDAELLHDTKDLLHSLVSGSYLGRIDSFQNAEGRFYGTTSLAKVNFPKSFDQDRQEVINSLLQHGYTIEESELAAFQPRLIISLGVPFPEDFSFKALPVGSELECVEYAILRLVIHNGTAASRLVIPS